MVYRKPKTKRNINQVHDGMRNLLFMHYYDMFYNHVLPAQLAVQGLSLGYALPSKPTIDLDERLIKRQQEIGKHMEKADAQ